MALQKKSQDLVACLIENGADVNVPSENVRMNVCSVLRPTRTTIYSALCMCARMCV